MEQYKALAIHAVKSIQGDDLYRARAAFKYCTPEQMQEQHGQSGKTRAEVLAQYELHHKAAEETLAWLNSL